MASIEAADYETVEVTCDHCKTKLLLNRRDDLGDCSPVDGCKFACLSCGRQFWMTGDVADAAYEMFIYAADRFSASKHHMLTVMGLAQGWEVFLATFAQANFGYWPFWFGPRHAEAHEALSRCQEKLGQAIRKFGLHDLLNLTTQTIVRQLHPRTLAEAESMIDTKKFDALRRDPAKAEIMAIKDEEVREAVLSLRKLRVAELRNEVAHKNAYRPSEDEVRCCIEEEIVLLHYVRDLFGVGELDEFVAGSVEPPRWFRYPADNTIE